MVNKKIGKSLKIVFLGGGIGTSVLVHGFKKYSSNITVITSMADDGGSSGRFRKEYNIMPVGDMVSCIAALVEDENKELAALLTYRFPGKSLENKTINGHKLGNIIMLAELLRTKDIYKALDATKQMFGVRADIFPASDVRVHLSAITKDGRQIRGETALDVAKYSEPYGLKKIYITPKSPKVNPKVIRSLLLADVIISGPGDLYTNQLPVLIIPEIKNILIKRKCKKIFVLNIANKPFETKGFTLTDFVQAISEHLGSFPFDTIIANSNVSIKIPNQYKKYKYIQIDKQFNSSGQNVKVILKDVINKEFPIYHDSGKLANVVAENI
jgi:uncharacterized cofD-like protein